MNAANELDNGGERMVHSQSNEEKLEAAKDLVINSIGQTMDLYGTNRSVGNLFGTMVVEGSMTLDEMREHLQMSKPSMSAGVKKLQEFDLVKQQFTRGSRKQHFIAEKDFFTFFRNFFTKKWEREVDTNMAAIIEAEKIITSVLNDEAIDDEIKQDALNIEQQLKHTKIYCQWLSNLTTALETGEIFDYFPIPNSQENNN